MGIWHWQVDNLVNEILTSTLNSSSLAFRYIGDSVDQYFLLGTSAQYILRTFKLYQFNILCMTGQFYNAWCKNWNFSQSTGFDLFWTSLKDFRFFRKKRHAFDTTNLLTEHIKMNYIMSMHWGPSRASKAVVSDRKDYDVFSLY